MAVLGRLLISSAERLDLPDLLSIDSYAAGDFKFLLKGLVGSDKPFVLKGLDIIDPQNAIGTQGCSIRVAESVVFYPGSDSGSFFHGLPEGHVQAAPLVPELRKNAVNYVYLTFSTFNSSSDARSFWDPDKDGGVGGEFTQDVNTESVLKIDVNVSTASFPTNTIPVAKVTVGPVVITAIEDARDMMFRLGSGGISPNPYNQYSFRSLPSAPYKRLETPGTMLSSSDPNAFQGADKNIYSLKEWMDVVMTKLMELGGTTYWYEDASTMSLVNLFNDALATTFKSKGQWQHSSATPGLITWTEDVQIKGTNTPKDVIIRAGNKTLANEQVAFLSLVRNQPLNGTDLPVAWSNAQNYVNTVGGAIGLFANLAKGDWVKKVSDGIHLSLRVEEFYDAVNLGGSTTTAALAKSIRLSGNYQGSTGNEKGRYDKGIYQPSDVSVVNRSDASLTTAGGNMHWIAMRSDTIQNVSAIDTFTLLGTLSDPDGQTIKVSSVAHGMQDGDRITVVAPAAQAGTYLIEVEDVDTFYFNTTNMTTGAMTAYYGLATTAARTNGYGLTLESATHDFLSGDTVIVAGTTNFNGTYLVNKRNSTQFQFPFGSDQAAETTGTATLAKVNVRSEEGLVKIVQGESISIGDLDSDNIRKFIGMDSLSQVHPEYFVPVSYNTLHGMANYNSLTTDNVVHRLSKLTAMMADKAQDKTVKILPEAVDFVDNTTNGALQDISFTSFSGTPSLHVVTPGSSGGVDIGLTGTLSLAVNQVAYFSFSRNSTSSIADLSGLTIVDIGSLPIDENILIIAFRLSGTPIWIWDATYCPVGSTPLAGGGGTGVIVTLYDPVSTTLTTGSPVIIDNVTVQNNDTVLFSNLAMNNNRVYKATVTAGNVTNWAPLGVFSTGLNPTAGDSVRFKEGDSFAIQLAVFDGTTFKINDVVRYFSGTDYWEVSSLKTSTLLDNTTNNVFTVNFANSENMIVDYSILRGTVKETGTIHVTTDGTTAVATTTGAYIGSSGVSFSADISGLLIRLRYTTTSTGSDATMKYIVRRWPNAAGGPGGPPTYSGGGGGGGAAAGANGDIQFNSAGVLGANSNFKIDTITGAVNLNGLEIRRLDTSAMVDNQAAPATIITYSASTYPFAIIEYSIARDTDTRVGRLMVTSNGVVADESDDYVETNPTGVVLSATVSGGNVLVQYTSTATGFAPSFKYSIRRWG